MLLRWTPDEAAAHEDEQRNDETGKHFHTDEFSFEILKGSWTVLAHGPGSIPHVVTEPKRASLNAVIEMVDAIDTWHKDAHTRLRKEYDELKDKVDSNYEYFRGRVELNATRLETLNRDVATMSERPVSFDKIFLSPRIWLWTIGWLLVTVVSIVVAVLSSSSSIRNDMVVTTQSLRTDQLQLRSDVRDIITRMDAQQKVMDARDKQRDVQADSFGRDLAEVKRLQLLQQLTAAEKKAGK